MNAHHISDGSRPSPGHHNHLRAPCLPSSSDVDDPQPKQNIWVTLAKTLQQDSLCMPMGSVNIPLSTCLVGIPLTTNNYLYTGKKPNPVDTWDEWTRILPHAPEEPQEMDLLGSSQVMCCVQFYYRRPNQHWTFSETGRSMAGYVYRKNATPNDKNTYTLINWCNYTSPILSWS